jgi:hypothetical protein
MENFVDLSTRAWTIHANGFDGSLQFTTVSDLDRHLNSGTVFGDPITNITYNPGSWIRFTRNNPWFTQVYSGTVVVGVAPDSGGVQTFMLVGSFSHEPGYAPGTSFFWCTEPEY